MQKEKDMSSMNLNVGIKNIVHGTRIADIKVPDQLRNRVKTGIEFFDTAVGDLVPSSAAMITGTPGAGKTTLMLQLADSIVASGHMCLYNTGEESLYQVKMTAERLGLCHNFFVGQDAIVSDILNHADMIKKQSKGKQVFLIQDSIATADDGKYANSTNSMTSVRVVEMLTDWAKSTYGIVLAVGQVTKSGEFAGKNQLLHTVDLRAELYIDKEKKSETFGERIFEVTKNRFASAGNAFILGMDKKGLHEKGSLSFS